MTSFIIKYHGDLEVKLIQFQKLCQNTNNKNLTKENITVSEKKNSLKKCIKYIISDIVDQHKKYNLADIEKIHTNKSKRKLKSYKNLKQFNNLGDAI